jgi:hypothetical protein
MSMLQGFDPLAAGRGDVVERTCGDNELVFPYDFRAA